MMTPILNMKQPVMKSSATPHQGQRQISNHNDYEHNDLIMLRVVINNGK